MRKPIILLLVFVFASFLGCVPSLNPFYTEKDVVFDQKLVGAWTEDDGSNDTWTFTREGDRQYKLVITEGDQASSFTAHLFRIGEQRFLDLFPDKSALEEWKQSAFYKSALIRGHFAIKVSSIEPELQMSMLDVEWLGKLLEQEPKAVQHHKTPDGELVLSASTMELQQFLLKHVKTPNAWGEKPSVWKRKDKANATRP